MSTSFWDEVQVQCINDTAGKVILSAPTPFLLRTCDVSTPTLDEHRRTVFPLTVKPTDSLTASLFLFFDVGVMGHHLVIWIWMDPQTSGLDVKVGVFSESEQFNEALLDKLSRNDVQARDIGLSPRSLWPLEDTDGKRYLGISASANEVTLDSDESLSDYWNLHRPQVTIHVRDPVYFQRQQAEAQLKKDQPHALMQISGGIGHSIGEPVHENITLAALLAANAITAEIDSSVTYDSVIGGFAINVGKPDVWEFLRGVIWNDDPACALFNDQTDNNGSFGLGADWGLQYGDAMGPGNIIHRSHYGDLQFLHAMGAHVGEDPAVTKGKMMRWFETMYRLSVGDEVSAGDAINERLGEFFDESTTPRGSETLRSLIMGTTPSYRNVKIDRRALGICMHIIQDSYALGHTRRKLLNPLSDMDEMTLKRSFLGILRGETDETVKIFPHTPASFGKIFNFHCYTGQDKRHGLYDEVHNATLIPSQLSSFNAIIGGKDAIEQCTILAKHWVNRTEWSAVGPWLDSEVFALSRFATPSDTRVDEGLGSEPSD